MDSDKIIDRIESIRANNNKLWISILRIAFKNNPKEAKEVLQQILLNDAMINRLLKELCR